MDSANIKDPKGSPTEEPTASQDKNGPSAAVPPREKVQSFPRTPGVYFMKDARGRILYIGKAKNLRNRAGHYFTKAAREDARTADLVPLIEDVDFLEAESEVDAIFMEARLIKDIRPPFNADLKDSKTFPYLQIRTREDFPRVEITRAPRSKGVKLYGPFMGATNLRAAMLVLQKVFQYRNCSLDIKADDPKWRWYRPCLLHSIGQCTAPCNLRVSKEEYRKQIRGLRMVMEGKQGKLVREMEKEMKAASAAMEYERAAQLRDDIHALQNLKLQGKMDKHAQPEVFVMNPKKGVTGLKQVLKLSAPPRMIEGIDIATLGGEDSVASLVSFIDGLPFKPGYRRFRIKSVDGVDDYAAIREVVARRYRRVANEEIIPPDVVLIDGGKGQLKAARQAFQALMIEPPCLISLAKREEEVFRLDHQDSLKLGRNSAALRLLQYVRDEAHRFAQHYHHLLQSKRVREEAESGQ